MVYFTVRCNPILQTIDQVLCHAGPTLLQDKDTPVIDRTLHQWQMQSMTGMAHASFSSSLIWCSVYSNQLSSAARDCSSDSNTPVNGPVQNMTNVSQLAWIGTDQCTHPRTPAHTPTQLAHTLSQPSLSGYGDLPSIFGVAQFMGTVV